MLGSDFIKVYENAIPDDLCDKLIELHKTLREEGLIRKGRVFGGYSPYAKVSDQCNVEEGGPELLERANKALVDARDRYFQELGLSLSDEMELVTIDPQIQRYPKVDGFYIRHTDVGPPVLYRAVSFVAFLNDVEEGGETNFINQGIKAGGSKGTVVVFPPFWMFPHEGTIPLTDDKYILIAIHEMRPRET